MRIERAYLVYQDGGIANVFAVENFGLTAKERGKVDHLMRHAFEPVVMFAKGMLASGTLVRTASCLGKGTGDIEDLDWSEDLDQLPFHATVVESLER